MVAEESVVFVVDDNPGVRRAISGLLRSVGLRFESFASAQEFLRAERADVPACLVLDVRMPGMSGLDLQRELALSDVDIPIIFLTGHGDIPMSVRAMKAGAVEFLTKPFRDQELLDAVAQALERHRSARLRRAEVDALRERYASLTPRERQVMGLVVTGLLNKQIGAELGTSEMTIKIQRGQIMRKMDAGSLAELVKMAGKLQLSATRY
jgi:FixJ family two-component response regulator